MERTSCGDGTSSRTSGRGIVRAESNEIGGSPFRGVMSRPLMAMDSCVCTPCTVTVELVMGVRSSWEMLSFVRTEGTTRELVHWSSIMANPLMERPDLEWLSITGHVRLNEFVNSVCP